MAARIAISFVLGFLSPLVFLLGSRPFEVAGRDSVLEILSGCLAGGLYVAVCQYLVVRNTGYDFHEGRPMRIAMVAPILAYFLPLQPRQMLVTGLPMLLAGYLGTLAGAWAAAGFIGTKMTGQIVRR